MDERLGCSLTPKIEEMCALCEARGDAPLGKAVGGGQDSGGCILVEEGVREVEPTVDVATTHRDEDCRDAGGNPNSVLNIKIGLRTSPGGVLRVRAAIESLKRERRVQRYVGTILS